MTDLGTMLQSAALTLRDRGPYALWEGSHRVVADGTEWLAGPFMHYGPYPDDFEDWTEEARAEWYEEADLHPSSNMFTLTVLRKHENGRTMVVQQMLSPQLILHMNGDPADFVQREVEQSFTRCAETA